MKKKAARCHIHGSTPIKFLNFQSFIGISLFTGMRFLHFAFCRKEHDPSKPKQPLSAFFLFSSERHAALIAEKKNVLEVLVETPALQLIR